MFGTHDGFHNSSVLRVYRGLQFRRGTPVLYREVVLTLIENCPQRLTSVRAFPDPRTCDSNSKTLLFAGHEGLLHGVRVGLIKDLVVLIRDCLLLSLPLSPSD